MKKYLPFVIRLIVAIILLQTLYYKFGGHPESIYIFEKTGLGVAGRIGSGIAELIAAILILNPRTAWLGATLATGIMAGAIFMHLTKLGIEINGDGGTLFGMALVVFVLSLSTLLINRKNIPIIGEKL
ncbi:MAG: DoxX family protein [Flavobacteriaceae bacterium]|nr:DoxX family protein [Flavobacteriaceae bacterium]